MRFDNLNESVKLIDSFDQKRYNQFWKRIIFLGWVLNVADIFYFFNNSSGKPVYLFIYQGFILISLLGQTTYFKVCNVNADRVCILLNIFKDYPAGVVKLNSVTKQTNKLDGVLIILLAHVTVVGHIIYDLMLPMISTLLTDKVHGAFTFVFGLSWPVCVVRGFLQLLIFLPNSFVGVYVFGFGLIILVYLNRSISQVVKFIINENKIGRGRNGYRIAMSYRGLQIFLVICNEAYQTYVWPLLQFVGSCVGIIGLYFLLEYGTILPIGLVFIITACFVLLVGVAFLILDAGSRPILLSSNILRKVKYNYEYNWSRKFWRSCKPISLNVGPFHKMDRSRGPAFFRFILQRTFFLSVQSRNFRHN